METPKAARTGRKTRWRWLAPTLGVGALAMVQAGVFSLPLWPALFGDEFLRYENVTVVGQFQGYGTRWILLLRNGDALKMPSPDGVPFEQDGKLCVSLSLGSFGNMKARVAPAPKCATSAE